jgi:hypothetical protein
MRRIILAAIVLSLFLLPLPVSAVYDLPADRRINWSAGIPGGIPNRTTICANVKNAPYNAVGDGIHDDTAAIQAAIAACPVNQVVLLPAGTYRISGTLTLDKGIVVRGEGPDKTRIIQYANSHIFAIVGPNTPFSWGQENPAAGTNINITSGGAKGTDTVTLADASLASLISVGDLLWVDQLNDPELVNPVGTEDFCIWCGLGANGSRAMAEVKLVKARNGTTVQFDQPLYYNFQAQFQPRVVRLTQGGTVRGAGVEDLYVTWATGVTDSYGFRFFVAAFSWLKNVESYYCPSKHVEIGFSYGIEIRDSYIHELPPEYFVGDRGYGVSIYAASTASLIENNIFYYLHAPVIIGSSGGAGNVIGYNFFEKTSHFQPNWCMYNIGTHGAHTYMNLWEGNILNKAAFDSTHGSGSHQVVLRNYINRIVNCTQMIAAVDVRTLNYYLSFLGNVLGTLGCPGSVEQVPYLSFDNNPVLWIIGMTTLTGYPGDPKVNQTLIRHGNWECPNNAVQWDPNIADHNIPASLYLSSKPAFFGNLSWPAIGPDPNNPSIVLNGMIPAQVRYNQIMGLLPANCTEADWNYTDSPCRPDNTSTRMWMKIHSCENGTYHNTTETVSCVYSNITKEGDLDGDGDVDILDLDRVATHFGQSNAHPLWNVTADVVADNEIDIFDIVFVASRFT